MGLRFQRHLSVFPGLRLNLSKTGVSLSIGHRGFWYTIGPKGQRATIGLPGTGVSYTTTYRQGHPHGPAAPMTVGHQVAFAALVALMFVIAFAVGKAVL
jgi:hypothetical protein